MKDMGFGNLIGNHEVGELDCLACEEQFGLCSCGGVIHAEYQETFRRDPLTRAIMGSSIIILECEQCDDYEVE